MSYSYEEVWNWYWHGLITLREFKALTQRDTAGESK